MKNYCASRCDMSDSETPYFLIYCEVALSQNTSAIVEVPLGVLFNKMVPFKGKLATPRLDGVVAFRYLRARSNADYGLTGAFKTTPLKRCR